MAISLYTFIAGMTDYVTKHNANYSTIQAAVNQINSDVEALKAASSAGADLDYRLIAQNLLINGGFDWWQRGNSSRPDAWRILNSTPGYTIVRSSTEKKINTYSVRTMGTLQLVQNLPDNIRLSLDSTVSFYFGAYVKTNAEDQARIGIYNGTTTTYSSYHSGSNDWEFLKLSYSATGTTPSEIRLILDAKVGTIYWNGAVLIRGNPNAGPIYVSNDETLETLRVLSFYEEGSESVKGVGYLSLGDRELEKWVPFVAPKKEVPTVLIVSEIPTAYDVTVSDETKYGFLLTVAEIGGASGTDGFELSGIEWTAETTEV